MFFSKYNEVIKILATEFYVFSFTHNVVNISIPINEVENMYFTIAFILFVCAMHSHQGKFVNLVKGLFSGS